MLYCKKTVRFHKISYIHSCIFENLIDYSKTIEKDIWITSANDSKHRKGSKHYEDNALDIRTRNLSLDNFKLITSELFKDGYFNLILFEWREKVNGKWIKHKARFEDDNFYNEFQKYLDCKNPRVSHLHAEW